jgi:cysteine synthase A
VALVARWLAGVRPAEERTGAVFPDGPRRYVGTVFDDAYCREHRLLGFLPADAPEEIGHPADQVVTRWTRCTTIVDPLADAGERGLAEVAL